MEINKEINQTRENKITFGNVYLCDLLNIQNEITDVEYVIELTKQFLQEYKDEIMKLDLREQLEKIKSVETIYQLLTEEDLTYMYQIPKCEDRIVYVPLSISMMINGGSYSGEYTINTIKKYGQMVSTYDRSNQTTKYFYDIKRKTKTFSISIPHSLRDGDEILRIPSKGDYKSKHRRGDIVFKAQINLPRYIKLRENDIVFYWGINMEKQKEKQTVFYTTKFSFYQPFVCHKWKLDDIPFEQDTLLFENGGLYDKETKERGKFYIHFYHSQS